MGTESAGNEAGALARPVGRENVKPSKKGDDPNGPSSMPGMTAAEMAETAPSATHDMGMSTFSHQAMLM